MRLTVLMMTSAALIEVVIPSTTHVAIVLGQELFLVLLEAALFINTGHLMIVYKALNQDCTLSVSLFSLNEVHDLDHLGESLLTFLELVHR